MQFENTKYINCTLEEFSKVDQKIIETLYYSVAQAEGIALLECTVEVINDEIIFTAAYPWGLATVSWDECNSDYPSINKINTLLRILLNKIADKLDYYKFLNGTLEIPSLHPTQSAKNIKVS